MEMKLAAKLGAEDAEALARGTRTIVNQVAALKSMVGRLSRLCPPAGAGSRRDGPESAGTEVLALYETSKVPIAKRLAPGLPEVRADSRRDPARCSTIWCRTRKTRWSSARAPSSSRRLR
jgi:nitrogen fixation/metabolism regulation signal transduction histidine kinase